MTLTHYEYEKMKEIKRRKKLEKSKGKNIRKDYDNENWIIKRKEIYKRDNYRCVACGKRCKLNAHHLLYDASLEIWEVPDYFIVSLCDDCHKREHSKILIAPKKLHSLRNQ